MNKKGIIQIIAIASLLIIVITWFIIENFNKVTGVPLEMIPNNAELVIEIESPWITYNKLEKDNSIWQKLIRVNAIATLRNKLIFIDSLLVDDEEYIDLLNNSPLTIAIYNDSISGIESLILSKVARNPNLAGIKKMLSKKLGRDYGVLEIAGVSNGFKIVDADRSITNYFAIVDGVFVYSTSLNLLTKLLETNQGKFTNLTIDTSFMKLYQTSGSKAMAKVFVNYNGIFKLLNPYIATDDIEELKWVSSFASWTEIDLLLKNNELIFSGFTLADSDKKYLQSFQDQKPVKFSAINILPYNTNTMLWMGLSDFKSYFYSRTNGSDAKTISAKQRFDIDELIDVFSDEFVLASNSETIGGLKNGSWFAVKVSDLEKAKTCLKQLSRYNGGVKAVKYNNYSIGKINNTGFIPNIFGKAFSIIKQNYYTFIGDYIVFANSENSIKNIIGYVEIGKTLDLNDNFKNFSDNISTNSNLLVYLKPTALDRRFTQFFTPEVSRELQLYNKVISSFQGLSFQLTSGNPLCFTNIYTNHSEVYHEENLALWKTQLDSDIIWGPFLVSNHNTKNQNIIVFDDLNNMYLIDADGSILWKKKVDGKPISEVHEVDFYKNRKIQYLFNTGNHIYLIDRKGRNVTGYPKKLHSKATNGVVVFDYLKNKDYRLLLAQSDKRIYNYSIKGKEISGWKKPRTSNIVVDPVNRLLANKKDYIIITDIEDAIKIVDRKGNRRIKVSSKLKKAKNSDYYVNRTNSKGIIITTDAKGKLVYISSSGNVKYTDFGEFSPDHFFLYEDFNGDRSKDFIFIDNNQLKVFDRFKKILFSYDFGTNITIKPTFFSLGNKRYVLGVVADKEKTIYLFDSDGNIIISKGLVGETPFTVGNLKNTSKINLVSAAGKTLYNYRLN